MLASACFMKNNRVHFVTVNRMIPVLSSMHMLKKILLVILLIIGVLIGDVLLSRKRVYDSLNLHLKSNVMEYGDIFEDKKLIDEYKGRLTIEDKPDTKQVGDYEVRFILNDKARYGLPVKREYIETIHVIDTKPPVIELEADEVKIYAGNSYDFKDNILKVYDEFDGDINEYEINTDADLDKAGSYIVEVKAVDVNGLSNSKSYTLTVRNRVVSSSEGYQIIYNLLTGTYGYNRAAACGILANIRFESNFISDIGDYYYGLCQWGGSRKDSLYSYCSENGYDASTIEGQLAYMNYELTYGYGGVKDYLLSVPDSSQGAYDAAIYFCNHFEGAASNEGRGELAQDYYG